MRYGGELGVILQALTEARDDADTFAKRLRETSHAYDEFADSNVALRKQVKTAQLDGDAMRLELEETKDRVKVIYHFILQLI